jgi:hypothetical protein
MMYTTQIWIIGIPQELIHPSISLPSRALDHDTRVEKGPLPTAVHTLGEFIPNEWLFEPSARENLG